MNNYCNWNFNSNNSVWHTDCGHKLLDELTDDAEKYCGYCGNKLRKLRSNTGKDNIKTKWSRYVSNIGDVPRVTVETRMKDFSASIGNLDISIPNGDVCDEESYIHIDGEPVPFGVQEVEIKLTLDERPQVVFKGIILDKHLDVE